MRCVLYFSSYLASTRPALRGNSEATVDYSLSQQVLYYVYEIISSCLLDPPNGKARALGVTPCTVETDTRSKRWLLPSQNDGAFAKTRCPMRAVFHDS